MKAGTHQGPFLETPENLSGPKSRVCFTYSIKLVFYWLRFQDRKGQLCCKISYLETSSLFRYVQNYDARNRPENLSLGCFEKRTSGREYWKEMVAWSGRKDQFASCGPFTAELSPENVCSFPLKYPRECSLRPLPANISLVCTGLNTICDVT